MSSVNALSVKPLRTPRVVLDVCCAQRWDVAFHSLRARSSEALTPPE